MEKWKDIMGYEGSYKISNHGRVKSLDRKGSRGEFILKMHVATNGGYRVCLCSDTSDQDYYGKKTIGVTKLVAMHFIDGFEGYMDKSLVCRHKDGNSLNNKVLNIDVYGTLNGRSFWDLTDVDKGRISESFWRERLRKGEKVVDNSTTTIARRLGLKRSSVDDYISYMLDLKYENFKK